MQRLANIIRLDSGLSPRTPELGIRMSSESFGL